MVSINRNFWIDILSKIFIILDTLDDKEDKDKKFNSFDISSSGKVLCAGTNRFEEDSFLLFWDIRKSELAGGFWESHMDDITQVSWAKFKRGKLYNERVIRNSFIS